LVLQSAARRGKWEGKKKRGRASGKGKEGKGREQAPIRISNYGTDRTIRENFHIGRQIFMV